MLYSVIFGGPVDLAGEHFGQVSGSTFPDQVRDRLPSLKSDLTSSYGALLMIHPVPKSRGSIHPDRLFYACLHVVDWI